MTRLSALVGRIGIGCLVVAAAGLGPAAETSPAQAPAQPAAGDAVRGKVLFERTYKCYACHGFDGQTGSPRLVPMQRSRDDFIALLRKPPRETMPKYVDVPERDLGDLYAYVRSIPVAAPPIDSLPLLRDILERRAQATSQPR